MSASIATTTLGPDGNLYPSCAICSNCVFYENPALNNSDNEMEEEDEDEDYEEEEEVPKYLLDDVVLEKCPQNHHFHWECITTHKGNVDWCPACVINTNTSTTTPYLLLSSSLPPNDINSFSDFGYVADDIGQVHATVTTTEGGTETGYDIKSAILEEQMSDNSNDDDDDDDKEENDNEDKRQKTKDKGKIEHASSSSPYTPYILNTIRETIEQLASQTQPSSSSSSSSHTSSIAGIDGQDQTIPLDLLLQKIPLKTLVEALFQACRIGDAAGVLELIALMPTPQDITSLVNQTSVKDQITGWSPLFEAAASGRIYIIKTLLAVGANPKTYITETSTGATQSLLQYIHQHVTTRPDISELIQAVSSS